MSNLNENVPSRGRVVAVRVVASVIGALIAVLVLVLATRPASDSQAPASPLVGQPAPAISGATLDGGRVDWDRYSGRYVVVNFFATWCIPCRREHPQIQAFTRGHPGERDPAVIAVAYDPQDVPAARAFFREQGGNWPVVIENGARTAIDYGVRGLPESFVVGPDGKLVAHITGEVTAGELERLTTPQA